MTWHQPAPWCDDNGMVMEEEATRVPAGSRAREAVCGDRDLALRYERRPAQQIRPRDDRRRDCSGDP